MTRAFIERRNRRGPTRILFIEVRALWSRILGFWGVA